MVSPLRVVLLAALLGAASEPLSAQAPQPPEVQSLTPPPAEPQAGRDAERNLAAGVQKKRILDTLQGLGQFGCRNAGTSEADAALDWLAGRFRDLGLVVEMSGGPERTGYARGAHRCRLIGADGLESEIASAWPVPWSPPIASIRLALADRSAKGDQDDRAAIVRLSSADDVAVLTPNGLDALRQRGFRAVLVCRSTDADGPPGDVSWTSAAGKASPLPLPVFGIGAADGKAIQDAMRNGGRIELELKAAVETRVERRLLAKLPGGGAKRTVIVEARVDGDSGSPAAAESAAGLAVLFEAARVLRLTLKAEELKPLPFDLVFRTRFGPAPPPPASSCQATADSGRSTWTILLGSVDPRGNDPCLSPHERHSGPPPRRAVLACFDEYAGKTGFWKRCVKRPCGDDCGSVGGDVELSISYLLSKKALAPPVIGTAADTFERAVADIGPESEQLCRALLVLIERLRDDAAW